MADCCGPKRLNLQITLRTPGLKNGNASGLQTCMWQSLDLVILFWFPVMRDICAIQIYVSYIGLPAFFWFVRFLWSIQLFSNLFFLQLGHEPDLPHIGDTIFSLVGLGKKRHYYPNIFVYCKTTVEILCFLWNLFCFSSLYFAGKHIKNEIGLYSLFTIGLPAKLLGTLVQSTVTDSAKNVSVVSIEISKLIFFLH